MKAQKDKVGGKALDPRAKSAPALVEGSGQQSRGRSVPLAPDEMTTGTMSPVLIPHSLGIPG